MHGDLSPQVSCGKRWEDHETVFEKEEERIAMCLPVGKEFEPLGGAGLENLQDMILGGDGNKGGRSKGGGKSRKGGKSGGQRRIENVASGSRAEA